MRKLDLMFRVVGELLPTDHHFALYAAISRVLGPLVHGSAEIAICAIRGLPAGPGQIRLTPDSCIRIRAPLDQIPEILKLSGKTLAINGHNVRVGVPLIRPLVPAAALHSPIVTIKCAMPLMGCPPQEQARVFLDAVRQKLTGTREHLSELGLSAEVQAAISLCRSGPRAGGPVRRVVRIKERTIVGFGLLVSGLTAEESLLLQERGIGGRRRMGCGVFLPVRDPRQ